MVRHGILLHREENCPPAWEAASTPPSAIQLHTITRILFAARLLPDATQRPHVARRSEQNQRIIDDTPACHREKNEEQSHEFCYLHGCAAVSL